METYDLKIRQRRYLDGLAVVVGKLGVGADYLDTLQVGIPDGMSGDYYV